MRRIELELEHRYKDRFIGRHLFKGNGSVAVIGSSQLADVHLLGDEISGVHATLESTPDGWVLNDMGSTHGTWVQKQAIIEYAVNSEVLVQVGGHQLKLIPREINTELFSDDKQIVAKKQSGELFHQVVVRKFGMVMESHLLDLKESFTFEVGTQKHVLKAPSNEKWVVSQFDDVTVHQRLATTETVKQSRKDIIVGLWDSNLKTPMIGAVLTLLIVIGLVVFAPMAPKDELVELKPDNNQYTRIIYDAKVVKKQKEQSNRLKKTIAGKAEQAPAPVASAQPKSGGSKASSTKVVNNIKAAGLTALIGKISKRAAQNAILVPAAGRSPDEMGTGRALGVTGSTSFDKMGVKSAVGSGEGQKIAGIGTEGKGGGSSSYKGAGGLSAGNVGNASVGVLEEETEVQGGLDRDVIARIIKSQLGQIRYCYERQLSANPDLYGKVQVRFTIGAAGSVVTQTIGTSSLNNAMVEGCILRRIAGWQFPQPQGGTSVIVTYPFLFKSTR